MAETQAETSTGIMRLVEGFDHVQVTAPRDGEEQAKAFYGGVLGLEEVAKPAVLQGRGGAWYRCGAQQVHLGLEDDFTPQRKAHPAFLVSDLDALRERLEAAGAPITTDAQIPGYQRFYAHDPFGNRLEFMQRVQIQPIQPADDGRDGRGDEQIKTQVREQFGRAAAAYVASPAHATGDDLARLLQLAQPQPADHALDISTGGGHTALAVAPHVAQVIASDLTPRMLAAARDFITAKGQQNVSFVIADAEHLPFLDATFDLVTVRIAPHHYANIQAAVNEMARVLVPGGRLIVIDNIAPEDRELDRAVNEWDKRRDPSHVREYTATEWQGFVRAAGLEVHEVEIQRKAHGYAAWVERMQMPPADRDRLTADILAAPQRVRDYFEVTEQDSQLLSWAADYIILRATK
jgi:ubiquinone/menaquinone biosynthesis C-methylase UbiE/catechol 2,3-dioxygenase-like lactoylglutathione lyase family enzyme